jgi:S1-C subfamily serine protease
MPDLVPGQRAELPQRVIELRIDGPRLDQYGRSLGAMLVGIDRNRQVPAEFAPIDIEARELRPGAGYGPAGEVRLDLSAVPLQVDRLLLLLYFAYGGSNAQSLRDFERLTLVAEPHRFTVDLAGREETALIFAEIYRRGEGWRICANGQGFVGGMGALQSALGIHFPSPPRSERSIPPPPGGGGRGGGPGPRPPAGTTFTGSGFAVDHRHILTNAHVIEGMSRVDVTSDQLSAPAEIVFVDPRNDIALLRVTEKPLPGAAAFRESFDIHLGEDVVVLGFPLQGLLGSGPQATTGNVSALCGIGNDTSVMQFSAPIASGNSGGPILDQAGQVVGLVYSSLNKELVREGGSNAENINFGVKGAIVRSFLSTAGVDPRTLPPAPPRSRAEIVKDARAFLYRIRCEA